MGEQVKLAVPGLSNATVVGVGGFGTVFRARQDAFDRWVAVKVLSGPVIDELARSRFTRECRALGRLGGHPFIVPLYDAGLDEDGRPYLLMPFFARGSLQSRLDHDGLVAPDEAAILTLNLAGALHTAHEAKILHRDVKPDNVLFSDYDQPQLADFGIARIADASHTSSGVTTGTFQYSAPELFDGAPPSRQTDVYALAATAYAMLSGGPPFKLGPEEALVSLIRRITSDAVAPPPEDVPASIAATVMIGLAKDPTERFATAAEFAHHLLEGTASLPAEAFVALRDLAEETAELHAEDSPAPTSTEALPRDVATVPEPQQSRRSSGPRWTFAALVVAAVIGAAWYGMVGRQALSRDEPAASAAANETEDVGEKGATAPAAPSEEITVPDVRTEPLASARSELRALGLAVVVAKHVDDSVESPTVTGQRPLQGARVGPGETVRLTAAVPPKRASVESFITTDGSAPTGVQDCWGLLGVCLGAPLEQVTELLGPEDERYGVPGEVSRQWEVQNAASITVVTNDVDSITGMAVAIEQGGAQVALPEGLVLGQMDMGDAVSQLGRPHETQQDHAENWVFYRYSYRVGPEGSVGLNYGYNAEAGGAADPGGFNDALDSSPVLSFTVDYPFAHSSP